MQMPTQRRRKGLRFMMRRERGAPPPSRIARSELRQAGTEMNQKGEPAHEQHDRSRDILVSKPRTKTTRHDDHRVQAALQQKSVPLVRQEDFARRDK